MDEKIKKLHGIKELSDYCDIQAFNETELDDYLSKLDKFC